MGAAILVTAVVFGSTGFADRVNGEPTRAPTSASLRAHGQTASPSPSGRATLELRWTNGASWVRVTDGKGNVLINDIFGKGTVKQFTGTSLHVELGNAGAITMIDKGGEPRIAGKTGQVVRITVTGP